jgi:putative ABC transport system ATP-binding protein
MINNAVQPEVIMQCRGISKTFETRRGPIQILKDVSFNIRRGQITVISGRTGTGKSTLLGLLGGLDKPSTGEIWLDDQRIDNLSTARWSSIRRKKISILFQNFNLLPSWTAGENVEAAMLHTGINRQQRNEKTSALLDEFGLRERMEHLPCELSIGQQQMVALARAIVNEPAILLADEPIADVDPQTAQELVNRLVLLGRNGTTIIVATHGNFPLDVADRCFLLEDGRIKSCG